MTMEQAIKRNQTREARFKRAERTLRLVRQRIFDYEDQGSEAFVKACKVISTCKRILAPKWDARVRNNAARKLERTLSAFE